MAYCCITHHIHIVWSLGYAIAIFLSSLRNSALILLNSVDISQNGLLNNLVTIVKSAQILLQNGV